jgi:hypothetical protein
VLVPLSRLWTVRCDRIVEFLVLLKEWLVLTTYDKEIG